MQKRLKVCNSLFFWIHGIEDHYLNMATTGELVYKNYKGIYKEAHRIPEAEHNSVPNTMGFKNYLNTTGSFIIR